MLFLCCLPFSLKFTFTPNIYTFGCKFFNLGKSKGFLNLHLLETQGNTVVLEFGGCETTANTVVLEFAVAKPPQILWYWIRRLQNRSNYRGIELGGCEIIAITVVLEFGACKTTANTVVLEFGGCEAAANSVVLENSAVAKPPPISWYWNSVAAKPCKYRITGNRPALFPVHASYSRDLVSR